MHLWIEPELQKVSDLIAAIDDRLSDICRMAVESDDPDAFGLFDGAEHATGLGLVACQTYMSIVYGALRIEKLQALSYGPKHQGGLTKVQIINHAANYWKHNNEWGFDQTSARRNAIEKAFDSVGFPVGTDYPLSGLLTELAAPHAASLRSVIDILALWKEELVNAAASEMKPE